MDCLSCRGPVTDQMRFCPHCGQPIPTSTFYQGVVRDGVARGDLDVGEITRLREERELVNFELSRIGKSAEKRDLSEPERRVWTELHARRERVTTELGARMQRVAMRAEADRREEERRLAERRREEAQQEEDRREAEERRRDERRTGIDRRDPFEKTPRGGIHDGDTKPVPGMAIPERSPDV